MPNLPQKAANCLLMLAEWLTRIVLIAKQTVKGLSCDLCRTKSNTARNLCCSVAAFFGVAALPMKAVQRTLLEVLHLC